MLQSLDDGPSIFLDPTCTLSFLAILVKIHQSHNLSPTSPPSLALHHHLVRPEYQAARHSRGASHRPLLRPVPSRANQACRKCTTPFFRVSGWGRRTKLHHPWVPSHGCPPPRTWSSSPGPLQRRSALWTPRAANSKDGLSSSNVPLPPRHHAVPVPAWGLPLLKRPCRVGPNAVASPSWDPKS